MSLTSNLAFLHTLSTFLLTVAVLGLAYLRVRDNRLRAMEVQPRGLQGVTKRLERLEIAVDELEERHNALHASLKKLRSRVGMREAREQRERDEPDLNDNNQRPGETSAQWKARMREKLANGGLSHKREQS